jgi:hypothetical protein
MGIQRVIQALGSWWLKMLLPLGSMGSSTIKNFKVKFYFFWKEAFFFPKILQLLEYVMLTPAKECRFHAG